MKRILIADDDAAMRDTLRDILEIERYEVLEAADGQAALERIRRGGVDLLITDRTMPQLGGLELLQKLREEKRSIPVIVISGFGEERLWAEAIGLGAEDYIVKPFTPDSVLNVVKKKLQ